MILFLTSNNFWFKQGEKKIMDIQSESPEPDYVVKQSSPETERAATTAMWLEIIFGVFGFLGIGHIYSGRTALGIVWMIGWWVYIAITTIVLWTISPVFAVFICGPLGLAIPIISGIQAHTHLHSVGGNGRWRSISFFSWLIITTCVILATTTKYQNYGDNFSCKGERYDLGVGFPVSFLCDYGGSGGSPLDSWYKVDSADFPYFSLPGLWIDGAFYLSIVFSIAWVARYIYRKDSRPFELYRQMALMTIAFAIGFFFTTSIIDPGQEDHLQDYYQNSQKLLETTPNFSLPGLLTGSLQGLTIAFAIACAVHYVFRKDLPPFRPDKQMILIALTFTVGFLFAVFIINANYKNFQNYINRPPLPTTIPSPTAVPSPAPIATSTN
jgi:hypothetical protein